MKKFCPQTLQPVRKEVRLMRRKTKNAITIKNENTGAHITLHTWQGIGDIADLIREIDQLKGGRKI